MSRYSVKIICQRTLTTLANEPDITISLRRFKIYAVGTKNNYAKMVSRYNKNYIESHNQSSMLSKW